MAPTHNIKLAIYKDIHRERANTCVFLSHRDRDLIAFLFSTIPRKMGLGIYIFGFVCLRWWFVCLLWWFDDYLKSKEKVD